MRVLVFFALIGALTSIFLVGLGGLFLWSWQVERIRNQPTKTLRELKKEWQLSAVEDR